MSFSVAQMEAGREPLHRRKSCYHQPLELAPGPHLGLGVPHPTADGHLQTDPRQQGQSLTLELDISVFVCILIQEHYGVNVLHYDTVNTQLFDQCVTHLCSLY